MKRHTGAGRGVIGSIYLEMEHQRVLESGLPPAF